MNNKEKRVKKTNGETDLDYGMNDVVSTRECTGMMYSPPLSEENEESYTDIYNISRPTEKKKNKR